MGIIILVQPLLLLLSRFSRVRFCATPKTAAHQAPPSLGFSRQEYWSGLPFPSPVHKSESEVAQSCPTPSDPMECSLPGSSYHGICQARVLECVGFFLASSYFPLFASLIHLKCSISQSFPCFKHFMKSPSFQIHSFIFFISTKY